jgi:two-component system chemotaxis response regulator CheY
MQFLVADDDTISRMAVVDLLENVRGAVVEQVNDGLAAQKYLMNALEPCICVLDVRMPGLSGIKLLEWIRSSPDFLGWPVLLITSQNDKDTVQEAARLRVDGYVIKPAGLESVQRLSQTAERFAGQLLERPAQTCARLNITAARYSQYIASFAQQMQHLMRDWGAPGFTADALSGAIDACRTAGMTLGCNQLQLVLSKAAQDPDPRHKRAIAMAMQGVISQYRRYATARAEGPR